MGNVGKWKVEINRVGKALFITGTGTDIGKTYVTGLIVKKIKEAGWKAGYYKAAMSGNERRGDGSLIPGDAAFVKEISGISQPLSEMCPYVYEHAYSPHLASRIEGNPVQMRVVLEAYEKVCEKYDYVTVEGSGGILCPIGYDGERIQLEDIVKAMHIPSLLIADAGLGTINSVVLTHEYMKARNMPVVGIIFNNWSGGVMQEDNLKMCEEMTGLKVLAKVSKDAADLEMDVDALLKLYA